MTITLYNNLSPSNFVDKNLTIRDTYDGTIRTPTSIIDPIIVVARSDPANFNYAWIPSFARYYFVTGVSSESNGLIAISMHVDVLMSYRDNIRAADAIVKRQEFKFNTYLDDGIFKAYQPTKHKIIALPRSFTDTSFILALGGNTQ